MKSLSLFFGFFLFSSMAWADLDVSCLMEDCLTEGWQVVDTRSGQTQLIECEDLDCEFVGWSQFENGREMAVTQCKDEGCFEEGWRVFNPFNGQLLSEVTCGRGFTAGQCLENGWTTFIPGRGSYQTRCRDNDCRNSGWIVQVPGFAPQTAQCKSGGCFQSGWVLFQ